MPPSKHKLKHKLPSTSKQLKGNKIPENQVVTLHFNVDEAATSYLGFMLERERRTAGLAVEVFEGISLIRQVSLYYTIVRLFSSEDGELEQDDPDTGLRLLFQESNQYLIGYKYKTFNWCLDGEVDRELLPFILGQPFEFQFSTRYPNDVDLVLANNTMALRHMYQGCKGFCWAFGNWMFHPLFFKFAVIFAEALRFYSIREYIWKRLQGMEEEAGNIDELMDIHAKNWRAISDQLHKDGRINLERRGLNDDLSHYNMTVEDIKAGRGIRVILARLIEDPETSKA